MILPWLLSSVAYLLFHNSAFLANAILKMPVVENSWSFLVIMVPLYLPQVFWNFRLASENVCCSAMNGWPAKLFAAVPDLFGVTKREKEVFLLLRQGLNNAQIASRLFISAVTVKKHIHNSYQKTGSRNWIEILNSFFPPRHAEKINLN